jgi:hypothetical protein
VRLLRCSLRQHQWRGSEKRGDGQTREHDNLIGMNPPFIRDEKRGDSLMFIKLSLTARKLDKHLHQT